jgi:homoserine O-succinyltransferase
VSAAAKFAWQEPAGRPLVIGLVNNMAVPAMASTKAQFAGLLQASGRPVNMVCFTMRPPQDRPRDHLPIEALADRGIDAVIVTGMELSTSNLRDEWVWQKLTRLHDWCEQESLPAIWSCLAAHAAVLHRDDIARKPLGAKLSGVFDCQRAMPAHRLTNGLPSSWCCPHSRYNGLSRETLVEHGYTILSGGDAVGVDIFTHGDDSLNIYFQGHPEYQPTTLLREFLRDLRRYVAGEASACPSVPTAYLDSATEAEFAVLREWALGGLDVMRGAHARALHAGFRHNWTDAATRLYANWLDIVAEQKLHRSSWAAAMNAAPAAKMVVR